MKQWYVWNWEFVIATVNTALLSITSVIETHVRVLYLTYAGSLSEAWNARQVCD